MRTTLELPDELLKRAKMAAIERGCTLRQLMSDALARDLDVKVEAAPAPRRTRFPYFAAKNPGRRKLSGRAIAAMETSEDGRRLGLSR